MQTCTRKVELSSYMHHVDTGEFCSVNHKSHNEKILWSKQQPLILKLNWNIENKVKKKKLKKKKITHMNF